MVRLRVLLTVLALLAVPFVASAAQSRGNQKIRTQNEASLACTPDQAAALARARAAGHQVPVGLENKNCEPAPPPPPPPPPPPSSPPTGPHWVDGLVYEDVDGDGKFNMFAGEMGLAGWTANLYWDGRVIASAVSDQFGQYRFDGLANATLYNLCLVEQSGYIRTQPAAGTACGGAGYAFSFSSSIATQFPGFFGMMLAQ